jgi:hypothetical protein
MSVMTQSCVLGCGSNGTTCATFVPSNNLASALAAAASAAPASLPDGATIDSDTGVVSGATLASMVIGVQNISIRVFIAPSWSLPNLRITGADPIAFVATGTIDVHGVVDVSSQQLGQSGAGADATSACHGGDGKFGGASGGGGGATAGGSGANSATGNGVGGAVAIGFEPLVGGCSGGGPNGDGGPGGGAIQLVSLDSVTIEGTLDVSGAGGGSNSNDGGPGGGAGGQIVIESPTVSISSTGAVVGNGGGGAGGCAAIGHDGGATTAAAVGGSCADDSSGGNGGTGMIAPTNGGSGGNGGGGGGAAGRARIATRDGTAQQDSSAVISIAITADMLVPN